MRTRTPLTALGVSALVLSLAACFGGTTGAEQSSAPQQSSGPVEIRYLIGQPESPEDLANIKADIKTFEAGSNGITVKLDVVPSENVKTILQTQLRSGKGPDVFGYDTGPGFAGALAKAGPGPRPDRRVREVRLAGLRLRQAARHLRRQDRRHPEPDRGGRGLLQQGHLRQARAGRAAEPRPT